MSKEEEQLPSWKAYARKGQDSCNYSYRLSKTEQLRSGFHRSFLVVLCSFPCTTDIPTSLSGAEEALFLDRVHLEA